MASPITTTSSTLEGQFFEVMEAIAVAQASASRNPNNIQMITTYTRNMATGAVTFAGTLPTDDHFATGSLGVQALAVYVD